MKISKELARKLMKALGFTRVNEWSDKKLIERLQQVPAKVTKEDVPAGFEDTYASLCEADEVGLEGADKEETPAKPAKPAKATKPTKGKAPAAEKPAKPAKEPVSSEGKSVGLSAFIDAMLAGGEKDAEKVYEKAKAKFPGGVGHNWTLRTVARKLERLVVKTKKGADAKAAKQSKAEVKPKAKVKAAANTAV